MQGPLYPQTLPSLPHTRCSQSLPPGPQQSTTEAVRASDKSQEKKQDHIMLSRSKSSFFSPCILRSACKFVFQRLETSAAKQGLDNAAC